ncbi:MAG: carboxypeptidase-like regulatory domain-containing protein, partial [Bacteroidota bacterium]
MKTILSVLLLFPYYCFGQLTLSGIVKANEEPVAFANVIIHYPSGTFVVGGVTNDDGSFDLSLEKGVYQLTVSHLNFESLSLNVTLDKTLVLPPILLKSNTSQLEEVVVTAHQNIIRREIDKTVVNIENSPLAQSGNVFDALRSTPGMMLQNESIVMLGKSNVRVAVDGRMIELTGNELNNFLRSISASNVKEIEVITNPSARYEAEGNSGIVNIVTKQIKQNAWRNNCSVTHNQAKYGWQQFNNNFSYQKNKFSLRLSTAVNTGSRFIEQLIEPYYTEFPQRIDSRQKRNETSVSPRLQLDYKIDEQTTLGAQYLGNLGQVRQLDDLATTIFNAAFEPQQYLRANDVEFDQDRSNASYNLYFDRQLDTLGKRLTLNVDFLDYSGATRTNVWSERFDNQFNFVDLEFANQGEASYQINNYNAKLDMEHPTSWARLSYGTKSSFSSTAYQLDNFNTITGEPVFVPAQSN